MSVEGAGQLHPRALFLVNELENELDMLMGGLTSKQCHISELRAAMRIALKAAVQVCEDEADEWGGPLSTSSDGKHSAEHCADAIRAMMKQ